MIENAILKELIGSVPVPRLHRHSDFWSIVSTCSSSNVIHSLEENRYKNGNIRLVTLSLYQDVLILCRVCNVNQSMVHGNIRLVTYPSIRRY